MDGKQNKKRCVFPTSVERNDGSWAALDGNRNCHTWQEMSSFSKYQIQIWLTKWTCWMIVGHGGVDSSIKHRLKRNKLSFVSYGLNLRPTGAWWAWSPPHPETSMGLRKGPRGCSHLPSCHLKSCKLYFFLCLSCVIWTEDSEEILSDPPLAQEMYLVFSDRL